MAAIVTNKFRLNNAEQFYESFSEASTSFYLFVGRPQPWTSTTPFGGGSDSAPPTPLDNVDDEFMYFRDMLAAKRIAAADIQYAVPRHNWTSATVYDYYRGDYGAQWSSTSTDIVKTVNNGTNLWASTTLFYVITSLNNVYKCMWNNNGGASTVEPTGTSNSELTTADSYVWKYMYTLTTAQITDFLTADFMPVTTNSTVSAAAVNGAVRHYKIERGGAGYTNGTYATQTLRGDGSSATFTVTVSGGVVTNVVMVAEGTNYTFADCKIDSISGIGTPSTSAIVTPIIGPKGGHGYNAIHELGGFYVMTNTTISGTEGGGDFVVDQDFRRVGINLNPYNYGTTTIATAATLNALKEMTFSGTPGTFLVDENITGGTSGAKGKVVSWDATNKKLKYIQTQWTGVTTAGDLTAFAVAEVVTSASSATGTVSALTNPEIEYSSGNTIYAEDRAPISRATDQTENIKLIVEF
tara:strand:- start:6610 stop:8010 length:1401 start_codon:yes stop_codon:yes gene_type:complete